MYKVWGHDQKNVVIKQFQETIFDVAGGQLLVIERRHFGASKSFAKVKTPTEYYMGKVSLSFFFSFDFQAVHVHNKQFGRVSSLHCDTYDDVNALIRGFDNGYESDLIEDWTKKINLGN